MNKFNIKYRNQIIDVEKNQLGRYKAILPFRKTASGKFAFEKVENDGKDWKFTSNCTDSQDSYTVILKSNGSLVYTDDSKKVTTILDYIYGESPNENKITDAAEKIYDVAKHIYVKEFLGVNPDNVLRLRRQRLKSSLKLLGFDSIEDAEKCNFSSGYVDLAKVGKMLESYKSISFIKASKTDGGFALEIPKDFKIQNMPEYITSAIEDQMKDSEYFKAQDENLSCIRDLKDDYCLDMKKKVPSEEWKLYSETVAETVNLLLSLNYDLLTDEEKKAIGVKDLTHLSEMEISDKISSLIDSKKFSDAVDIENRFIISEVDKFSDQINTGLDDESVKESTSIVESLENLRNEALKTKSERLRLHTEYGKYSKMCKAQKIVFEHSIGKPEDSRTNPKNDDGFDYE